MDQPDLWQTNKKNHLHESGHVFSSLPFTFSIFVVPSLLGLDFGVEGLPNLLF